ncbi:MAG: DUF3306 domain-containing protein [Filomicrobium sp.]
MTDKASQQNSFLERWSLRKRGLAEDEPETPDSSQSASPNVGQRDVELEAGDGSSHAGRVADAEDDGVAAGEAEVPKKDFADFDFEQLDYDSDYKQFMGNDVSSDARHKALRKLWVSNPVLANMDGLDDYCEDYTDAAVCLPKGMMKTAYQYGRGFLNDEEVAEWEALGKEPEQLPQDANEDAEVVAEADTSEDAAGDGQTAAEDAVETNTDAVVADSSSGAGAACGAAVKQEDAQMLAEFEAEKAADKGSSKA